MTIKYDGTLNCAISVSDMDRAVAWYQEMLGFELSYRRDDIGWSELTTPTKGVTIGLSQVETVPQGGGATLVFGVEDTDAARTKLEQKDVRFDGETQTIPDMVKLATFFDPDGNSFMLAQNLAPQ